MTTGPITTTLTTTGVWTTTVPPEDPTFAHLHGICMFLAWNVLSTISIVSARRRKLPGASKFWFPLHWISSAVILVMSVVGVIFGFAQHHFEPLTWDWEHQFLGVSILTLAGVQGMLGVASHFLYNPKRTSLPWVDFSHHVIGRICYVASIYQGWLGMNVLFLIIKYKPIEYAYTLIYVLWTGLSLSLIVFSDVSGFGNPVLPIYSSSLDDVNSKDVY